MAKVMLVTGAGRGIGAATARLAAERGYKVCVNYLRDRAAAEKLANEIGALAVPADVSSEADVVRLFKTVDDKLGRLTALVNNAGIVDALSRVEDMSIQRLQRMFAVNVIGSFLCAREAIKLLRRRAPRLARGLRRLCLGEGRDRHFHRRPCEGSRRRRHPRQRGAPGSDPHRDPCDQRRSRAPRTHRRHSADRASR